MKFKTHAPFRKSAFNRDPKRRDANKNTLLGIVIFSNRHTTSFKKSKKIV